VCGVFSVEDLFVVGLGFDLSGAVLLAMGLFKSPSQVAEHVRFHLNPSLVRAGTDLIDGGIGLASLLVGFLLQAIGYVLLLSREEPSSAGLNTAAAGVALLLVAAAIPWVVRRLVRRRLLLAYLRELALYDNMGRKHERPSLRDLVMFAEIMREERRPDEHDDQGAMRYAHRVFGVRRFRDDLTGHELMELAD
jgi:hypothetical protein